MAMASMEGGGESVAEMVVVEVMGWVEHNMMVREVLSVLRYPSKSKKGSKPTV